MTNIKEVEHDRGSKFLFRLNLPNSSKIRYMRDQLSLGYTGTIELPKIKGISLIQPVSNRPADEDCGLFLLNIFNVHIGNVLLKGQNINKEEPNCIAFYLDNNGDIKHTGIVVEKGLILSKWTTSGGLFLHKPELIPTEFGNNIMFFKKPVNVFKFIKI